MLNDSLSFFWEEILKKNKLLAALFSVIVFIMPVERAFEGLAVGVSMLFVYIISALICSVLSSKIPDLYRGYVYILINGLLVWGVVFVLNTVKLFDDFAYLERFLPCAALSCGLLVCINRPWTERTVKNSLKDGVYLGVLSVVVLTLYAIIREIFSKGTLFNIELGILPDIISDFKFFSTAAGGFITMGLVMALVIQINNVIENKTGGGL